MNTPNLFGFATSELSQDAFIAWLLAWAHPKHRHADEALHEAGTAFLDQLLERAKVHKPDIYQSVEVQRQHKNIDILVVVNDLIAVIIEDKTNTSDHSDQLREYRKAISPKFTDDRIAAIYLKTGDQSHFRRIAAAGYAWFGRQDFLNILAHGEKLGVRSDIFADFHRYLRGIEEAVQSYKTTPIREWNVDWRRWTGFFLALQEKLPDGNWSYVPNASGGFMGFNWHWNTDTSRFLQLENDKLCFKIQVPEEAQRSQKWVEWNQSLTAVGGSAGVPIKKPVRRAGRWMTVAILDGDYRQADSEGRLDFDRTVEKLRQAEALMDASH